MDNLAGFLTARYDEEEAATVIPAAFTDQVWVSPADRTRVLADLKAKRRVRSLQLADEVDRILAEPYAGHPDYRQEWRP